MQYGVIFSVIGGLSMVMANGMQEIKAPRPDAPPVTSPISVVVPSLDLGAVLSALANINCKIGNVNQNVCDNTILSVLGDACTILGISISQAIKELLECCDTTTLDFNGVFTVLQDIQATLTNCGMPTHITQAMIPFTITQPGLYCLAEDVTLSGTGITIEASDVILDLNEHQMIGGVVGISVLSTANVIIKNGIVRNQGVANISVDTVTTLTNLLIEECQFLEAGINGLEVFSGYRDIIVQNSIFNSPTATGIEVVPPLSEFGARAFSIIDCFFDCGNIGIDINAATATATLTEIRNCQLQAVNNAINLIGAAEVIINGCTAQFSGTGISATAGTTRVLIDNCNLEVNNIGVFSTALETNIINSRSLSNGVGIQLDTELIANSRNSSVINCIVSSNQNDGIIINNTGINVVRNCEITGNGGNAVTLTSIDSVIKNCSMIDNGIVIHSTSDGITISECEILRSGAQGILINTGCSNITIENCVITETADIGISILASSEIVIRNCDVSSNTQNNQVGIQMVVANGVVDNCSFMNNLKRGLDVLNGSIGITIVNCRGMGNGQQAIAFDGSGGQILNCSAIDNVADGFILGVNARDTEVINCVSNGNLGRGFNNLGGATNKFYKNFATGNTPPNYNAGVALVFTPATVLPGTFGEIIGNTDD